MSYAPNNLDDYRPARCMNCDRPPEVEWVDTSTYIRESRTPGRHFCPTSGCTYTPRTAPEVLAERGRCSLAEVNAVWEEVFG